MHSNLVVISRHNVAERRGLRDEAEGEARPDAPSPHPLARLGALLERLFGHVDRTLEEWPKEQMPSEGELMLAGLGGPILSLSRLGAVPDPAELQAGLTPRSRSRPALALSAYSCRARSGRRR